MSFTKEEYELLDKWENDLIGDDELTQPLKVMLGLIPEDESGDIDKDEEGELGTQSLQPSSTESEINPEKQQPVVTGGEDKQDVEEKKQSKSSLGQKYYEKSNQANHYMQKTKNLEKILSDPELLRKEIEKRGLKVEFDKVDEENIYEESEQAKLAKFYNSHQEREAQRKALQSAMENDVDPFDASYSIQENFEHLVTETDIKDIDSMIVDLQRSGVRVEEKHLIEKGISQEDLDKYKRINEIVRASSTSRQDVISYAVRNGEMKKALEFKSKNIALEEVKKRTAQQKKNDIAQIPKPIGSSHSVNTSSEDENGDVSDKVVTAIFKKESLYGLESLTKGERAIYDKVIGADE